MVAQIGCVMDVANMVMSVANCEIANPIATTSMLILKTVGQYVYWYHSKGVTVVFIASLS